MLQTKVASETIDRNLGECENTPILVKNKLIFILRRLSNQELTVYRTDSSFNSRIGVNKSI